MQRIPVRGDAHIGLDAGFGALEAATGRTYSPTVSVISGGNVGGSLEAAGASTVNVSGGSIDAVLRTIGSSVVNISGGDVRLLVTAMDRSIINVSGGLMHGPCYALEQSAVNVNGGVFDCLLRAEGAGAVFISGGHFNQAGQLKFADGTDSAFVLIGHGLSAGRAGVDPQFGMGMDYVLTGTLKDGSSVTGDVIFVQRDARMFILINLPPVTASGNMFAGGSLKTH